MSRNSSGTYSLPAGNPVVTGTTITSTWANTTLSDIATALTDSLSRTGQGGMLAGLGLFDGTSALPGLSWATELTSGFYRAGAADFRWVIGTTELLQLTGTLFRISGTAPEVRINETDAAANNRLWSVIATAEDMNFRVLTDALVATNWMTVTRTAGTVDSIALATTVVTINNWLTLGADAFTPVVAVGDGIFSISSDQPNLFFNESDASANEKIWRFVASGGDLLFTVVNDAQNSSATWLTVSRTGTTVDSVNLAPTSLQYGGVEVGFRPLNTGSSGAGNFSLAQSDGGMLTTYTGTGGHTVTLASLTSGTVVVIINAGSGACTLAPSTALEWFNGSGTISTGNRTLAVGGVCTVRTSGSGNWRVWGTGLS